MNGEDRTAPPIRARLSRVPRIEGAVTWYIESDHLLLADQKMFTMRYRRFYFADLQSVTIWPNRRQYLRIGVCVLIAALAACLAWLLHAPRAALGFACLGGAAVILEVMAGPKADARIQTVHSEWRAPLAPRWRQAEAILARLASLSAPAPGPDANAAAESTASRIPPETALP